MRRALIIGIDAYVDTPLSGCVKDAESVASLLECNEDGSPNFDCRVLVSSVAPVTRDAMMEAVNELLQPGAEVALLYFAGHGAQDDHDGYLVPQDWSDPRDGVRMGDLMRMIDASSLGEVVILLDSCHSGRFGDATLVGQSAVLKEGVSILTASRRDQPALERAEGGVFTSLLIGALDGSAADVLGTVTLASAYAYLDEALGAWDQRPLFKSHVSRLVPLRRCAPAVDLDTLRKLPSWFAEPSSEFPLDRSYEPNEEPQDAVHQAIFEGLQSCRAAKLVEPVGERHMYYAAVNGKSCRLTQLGRRYWRLAKDRRF